MAVCRRHHDSRRTLYKFYLYAVVFVYNVKLHPLARTLLKKILYFSFLFIFPFY